MKVEVEIPEGKYCDGCPFLSWHDVPLIGMFGDPTGNTREEILCTKTGMPLVKEERKGNCHCLSVEPAVKNFVCPGRTAYREPQEADTDDGKGSVSRSLSEKGFSGDAEHFPVSLPAPGVMFPGTAAGMLKKMAESAGNSQKDEEKEKH